MSLPEYIGHLHPVLVHLPIGILLTAILFDWLSHRKGFRRLRKSVRLLLFLGFIAACLSSFTGYLLSRSGDYDESLLDRHQWLGISVSVLSFVLLLLRKGKEKEIKVAYSVMLFVLAMLVLLAGHAGGSLTHGAEFLKPPPMADWFGKAPEPEIQLAELPAAFLYKDLIAPVLQAKCSRCHGSSRQKGKLRLDQPEYILKGGEDGVVVDKEHWQEGDLLRRIHLEREDDDHMPPKDKNQLSKRELALLTFWIKNGADFQSKLGTLAHSDSLIRLLSDTKAMEPDEQTEEMEVVAMPDSKVLETLKAGGIVCSFLRKGSGSILLSFLNADTARIDELIKIVPALSTQVSELRLTGCHLASQSWSQLSGLTSLRKIYLENSNITDKDLLGLSGLPKLEYINLVSTDVTVEGVSQLKSLANLKKLYVYNTKVTSDNQESLSKAFPKTTIDFGNYQVPTLASDTTVLTKPIVIPQ